jgi:oligopeptidase B
VQVPISLVHRKGILLDGSNPTLLYGYGSYGISIDAAFSSDRVSLLERGFVYAIAHIRGGGDLGKTWHDAGKLKQKRNTFDDFIAAAEFLISEGYTSPAKLAILGGSAGGLLMGAVINQRPGLFRAVVAKVPFVDVLNTATDPTLPLTVIEYDEWGNSNEREYWEYIRSYSPYDNVKEQPYPHILATAGLNDPRVSYWEPAKWIARLRTLNTSGNMLLLKTNMDAGHGGASGRYERMKETAFDYAFLLHALGV